MKTRKLLECVGCDHMLEAPGTDSCDCMQNPLNQFRSWIATPVDSSKLWCVHVTGADDVHPMPSRSEALEEANSLNAVICRNPREDVDPVLIAVVTEWPHSADSHAAGIAIRDEALRMREELQATIGAGGAGGGSPAADQFDGPQASTIEEAARDVGKWLNERPNRPLDLRNVAMLSAYVQSAVAEPVAWMHDQPGRVDVIHNEVKKLLVASHDAAGHLHRPLDKAARYTIPLYGAPAAKAEPAACLNDWFLSLSEGRQAVLRDDKWKLADAAFEAGRAALAATPAADFQQRVQPWLMECFGEMIAGDREERNHRFLEESLELVQACGCTASEAHQLVDYVFNRPVGEPVQEAGGVMVTLAALCLANGLNMHQAGETELARIWTKVESIRAKQAAKPEHSPLPVATPATTSASDSVCAWSVWWTHNKSKFTTSRQASIASWGGGNRSCARHRRTGSARRGVMRLETKLAKAKAESADFGRYAEVMLEEVPDMSMPVLRDCYVHRATAGEYRAHLERQKGAHRAQTQETS